MGEIANQGFQQISSLIYDEIGDQIYFIDFTQNKNSSIYRLGRDPKNPSTYITLANVVERVHEKEKLRGLAFDPVERNLYWIDQDLKKIFKLDVKQPQAQPTIWHSFEDRVPQALSVDVCRRFLYWTTHNDTLKLTTIEKARLGSGQVNSTVLISEKVKRPIALEIDQFSNRMFWIDDEGGTQSTIESANLEGDDRKVIYEGAGVSFRSLIVDQKRVLVVDHTNERAYELKKSASSSAQELIEFETGPRGLIKRSRFVDTHEEHAICQSAIYYLKEQQQTTEVPPVALVMTNNSSVICLNGKVDDEGHCKCSDGWKGKHCETKVCQNYCFHGTCAVASTGYPLCHCEAGFVGERCESSKCHGYCLNEGSCRIEGDEPVCHCLPSFTGRHCEIINSKPVVCRAFCELGMLMPNLDWELEDECM